MDKFNLNYSMKNIPIGNEKMVVTRMYGMAAKFINRMRWKAHWFSGEETTENQCDDGAIYRFPSKKSAPKSEHLTPFENDLYDAIKKIKFRKFSNDFQSRLKNDARKIRESKELLISADKTTNIYKVPPCEYKSLITKAINRDYRKAPADALNKINDDAMDIIEKNKIKGRVKKYEQKEAFITIKDHKAGFPTTVKTRLINPSKTHIGKVAKTILDEINNAVKEKSKLVQWRNTQEVLSWFEYIPQKNTKCFVKFDIVDFYPSITSKSITQALKFARKYTKISRKDERIIRHSCKTLMFHDGKPWVKRGSTNFFDVPMGFYGSELCELIGLMILNAISDVFPTGDYGLYRDDGLAVVKASAKCNLLKTEQRVRKMLQNLGFDITIESGLTSTDFLDVNLDLRRDTFSPYRKPNSNLMYVNKHSNHPPNITRTIPKMVIQRLCRLSKDKPTFDNSAREYLDELKSSGHDIEGLSFQKPKSRKRKRKRNIIYFHPPFCRSVKTKFGRTFRELVEKHFTPDHALYKIFNKNTLKISYSCLPNMKSILDAHNRRTIDDYNGNSSTNIDDRNCNCRRAQDCPFDGHCLSKNVIYRADVSEPSDPSKHRVYIGSTTRAVKVRYGEHKADFKNTTGRSTKLSNHILGLKEQNKEYNIKWQIINKSSQSAPSVRFCTLCNLERLEIARATKGNLLNSRNELVTLCQHYPKLFF